MFSKHCLPKNWLGIWTSKNFNLKLKVDKNVHHETLSWAFLCHKRHEIITLCFVRWMSNRLIFKKVSLNSNVLTQDTGAFDLYPSLENR